MRLSEYTKNHVQRALAERLRVPPPLLSQWVTGFRQVPAGRVLPIYHATRGAVTPYELRPDLYPDPSWLPPLDLLDPGGVEDKKTADPTCLEKN